MEGREQEPADGWGSKWFKRFTKHPMWWFFTAFIASIVVLSFLLQALSRGNSGSRPGFPSLAAIDVTSAALQAVVGTAVIGASAIVALLVAVAALRASERNNEIAEAQRQLADRQNALAEHQNELADPDYALSHAAYAAYRRYGFIAGSLIAAYRSFRHERELASYRPEGKPLPSGSPVRPRWDSLLLELRELLLNTPFQVAALEAALVLDRNAAAPDGEVGDGNQHDLRQAMASAVAALDASLHKSSSEERAEHALASLLSDVARLDRELGRGLKAVNGLPPAPVEGSSSLVYYLKRWMPLIQPVQVGDDFSVALSTTAFQGEMFAKSMRFGKRMTVDAMVPELLDSVFVDAKTDDESEVPWVSAPCTDPFGVGLNRAMMAAALIGDHTTVLRVRELAEDFAKTQEWDPEYISIRGPVDLFDIKKPSEGDGRFLILHVTPKTLPLLFHDSPQLLNPHTRGCVIVDGVRSADLAWAEDAACEYFEEFKQDQDRREKDKSAAHAEGESTPDKHCDRCPTCPACAGCWRCGTCADDPREFDIFVHVLARAAASESGIRLPTLDASTFTVRRAERFLGRDPVSDEYLEPSLANPVPSPRLAWIGIDYRKVGVEPPSRADNWTFELWSLLSRDSQLRGVSDEVSELAGL